MGDPSPPRAQLPFAARPPPGGGGAPPGAGGPPRLPPPPPPLCSGFEEASTSQMCSLVNRAPLSPSVLHSVTSLQDPLQQGCVSSGN